MRILENKTVKEKAYFEELENGLKVIIIPKENTNKKMAIIGTKFGSIDNHFINPKTNEEEVIPDGVAHFLEHKMFEQESGEDPFAYFSKTGTGSNASTSYNSTQYICYGTKNFLDNLRYLIQYVDSPYYTDDNVEKEKGIIAEELKMYADLPDVQLETRLRENIYHVHPRRVDIGGTVDEINKITKEDLYLCYRNFYSPNNMFLLVVGNFSVDDAIKVVHEELDYRENLGIASVVPAKEKKSVCKKEDSISGNIQVPKIGVGLKIAIKDFVRPKDVADTIFAITYITRGIIGQNIVLDMGQSI